MMSASSGVEGVNWVNHSFSLRTDVISSFGANSSLNRIVYANNLPTPALFAVGNAGTIAKSTDGVTWTYNTTVAAAMGSNNFYGIDYDATNNVLIACGDGGRYYRSTDGVNWTAYTQGSQTLQSARYLNGAWWMVGNAGTILKSTNGGTVWTAQSPVAGHAAYIIYDIAYGYVSSTTDKWMYVGENGLVAYSANGTGTWVNVRSPITTGIPGNNTLYRIIFVPASAYPTTGQFLIAGGRDVSSNPVPSLYRSVNTTTSFVLVTGYTPTATSWMTSVYYSGSLTAKYIMGTESELFTSADSVTWTRVTTPFDAFADLTSIGSTPYYVGFSQGGSAAGALIFSSNSAATSFTPIKFAYAFYSVTYNSSIGKYCATASSVSATSTDGNTWTPSFLLLGTERLYLGSINSSGPNFIAGGFTLSTGSSAFYSTDGVNWTAGTGGGSFNGIAVGTAGALAPVAGGSGVLRRSTDNGVTWTTLGTGFSASYTNIAFGSGTGYLVISEGSGGNIFSPDGFTWTAGVALTGTGPLGCAIQNSTYIITATNGNVYTSTNPAAGWTTTTVAGGVPLPSVGVTNKKSVVVTSNNGSIYSGRAVPALVSRTSGVTTPLLAVTSKPGQVIVVGENGTILSSP